MHERDLIEKVKGDRSSNIFRPRLKIEIPAFLLLCLVAVFPVRAEITIEFHPFDYESCGVVTINGNAWEDGQYISAIDWDWGDGTVYTKPFPAIHQFASNGAHVVEITFHGASGATRTEQATVQIGNRTEPGCEVVRTFIRLWGPWYGASCGQVDIGGFVWSDESEITAISWDWGDGIVSNSTIPASHEFAASGSYTVNATARTVSGDTGIDSIDVLIENAAEVGCEFSLQIQQNEVHLRDGHTSETLRIDLRDAEGKPLDARRYPIEFQSSDPDLVQVSADGTVSSTGYGRATVTATLGRQSSTEVYAGHLRTRPYLQMLSLHDQPGGRVWADIGNADGTPVDLDGHTVTFLCSGCEPGEPLQVNADGDIVAVELIEENDPAPLTLLAIVDDVWAQNWAVVHVSDFDYGLTLKDYEMHNTVVTSAVQVGDYDFDALIQTLRVPELMEVAFSAERELTGGTWSGGGRQSLVHYVSPSLFDSVPGCGGSGNPVRLGTDLYDPSRTCFVTEATPDLIGHGYGIPFHEMGHNFTWTHGRFADFADAGDGFSFSEGLATAAGMFACEAILRAGTSLGISSKIKDTIENSWLCWRHSMAGSWLTDYVASGADYHNLDPTIVDEILWTLIQEHDYGILYRFYSSLLPRRLGNFPFPMETVEQQATFFALAMSEATGVDQKARFRDDWGFPIDNAAWDLMQPYVEDAIAQRDPASNAGNDRIIQLGEVVTLDDAFVFDQEGDELTIDWQVVTKPPGANAQLGDSTVLHTTFTTNREGSYTLGLTATDQWVTGSQDTVLITVVDLNVIFQDGFE